MLIIPIIQNDFQGKVDYTRHACRAIIINEGKILLSYESKNDKYLIPGGGIEENESLIDCCKREVLEETGLIIRPIEEYLTIKEYFYWNKNWEHIQHYFICEIEDDSGKISLTETERKSGTTIKWLNINEAISIFSTYKQYEEIDKALYGLYQRELIAIQEYMKINRNN